MILIKEKFSLISELSKKKKELTGDKKLSLMGIGDFPGSNSLMRSTMNTKHHAQHLTIDNPEFPFIFNGDENLFGEHSSFYSRTDKEYKIVKIVKKYGELLKGKSYMALYFLHSDEDDSYKVVERKECENLTENFGFDYKNDYLDNSEEGDRIPKDTVLYSTTSYDNDMNVSIGVNGRILYGVHPAVQDDAILVSESFAKRMISNQISSKTIPVNENSIFVNIYGNDKHYQGLPNIGDTIKTGILAATRSIKETRMFSDLRDSSLLEINNSSDHVYYGEGEVVDINIYCNNPNMKLNKINMQLVQYYNDLKFFYSEVYRVCRRIVNTGSKNIDREINYWLRRSKEYLDEEAKWDFNDNVFSNLMVQILLRKKKPILVGDKISGRYGNKTVVSQILPDDQMPFITSETCTDQYGRVQPAGEKIPVELVTNPLAIINRTIPMALFEASMTFILARAREHMPTMEHAQEAIDFLFDIIGDFNATYAKDMREIYDALSDRQKQDFLKECIEHWVGVEKDSFDPNICLRDAIIRIYEKYGDIMEPYNVFVPKKKWVDDEHPNGRDIFVGKYHIGYQYIILLKQSGERGFSVRSAGAISDESLPEKSNENKIGKLWHSETPIRFGEYETPNFMIVTQPEDFALITALYRSSIDGRRFMYESILSEDGNYNIPDNFSSQTASILQVYLKSLGIRMETVIGGDEFIGEPEDNNEVVGHLFRNSVIFATQSEMYYVIKLVKLYKRYLKDNPMEITDFDEAWEWMKKNLTFNEEHLTDNVVSLFTNNLEVLTVGGYTA